MYARLKAIDWSRVVRSLLFGFGIWTAFVLAAGGRGCTPSYSFGIAMIWLEMFTVLGFVYWIPFVAIVAALSYLVVGKTRLASRPDAVFWIGAFVIVATFGVAFACTPPNGGHCSYL